jgi:hypothetical protein
LAVKYILTTSGSIFSYGKEDKERLERDFGFSFFKSTNSTFIVDRSKPPTVEINTLEELEDLRKKAKAPLILYGDAIEIYDEYRE